MHSGLSTILILGGSLLLAEPLTRLARRLALRWGFLDSPGGRKLHDRPTPLLGGIAISLPTILVSALSLMLLRLETRLLPLIVAAGGAALMQIVGFWDDARMIRARHKLWLQVLIAGAVAAGGLGISCIEFSGVRIPLGAAAFPLTILWIVACTNAWNLIDGIDGLAAGIGAIAAAGLAILLARAGAVVPVVILLALCGACLGFLKHNFHPATIFLGDGGSLFLGYSLAVAPLLVLQPGTSQAPLDARIPLLICIVPVADTMAAIARRLRLSLRIRSSWRLSWARSLLHLGLPDRRHLHHLLLERVRSQRRATLLLLAIGSFGGACALLADFAPLGWPLLLCGPIGIGVFLHRLGCLGPAPAAVRPASRAPAVPATSRAGTLPRQEGRMAAK